MSGWQDTFRRIVMGREDATASSQEEVLDRETGEPVQNWFNHESHTTCRTNAETGEIEPTQIFSIQKRSSFQVPKTVLHNHHLKQHKNNQMIKVSDMIDNITTSEYYYPVSIEQKFLNETHNISPVVFLLPTLFLFPFPAWLTVVSIIIELCLHMWAHKSNKECKDSHLRYRSPLHALTSQFCAVCKSKRSMQKIGKLQDARALKVSIRKPKYSTYVERVSVMM